jgi:hypothetical protein
MSGRRFVPAVWLALAISFVAPPSRAQSVVAVDGGVTRFGDEYESFAVLETGLRFSSLTPQRLNAEVRIATFPEALTSGFMVCSADVDAAFVVPLGTWGDATPRAGISLIGAAGGEGAAGAAGVNYGLGIVARLSQPLAVRFDYSHRTYLGGVEGLSALSFLIGIAWVH